MSNWLIIIGVVGAVACALSLLVLGCMLFAQGRFWLAFMALGGMALIIFGAILGDMYSTGWWDR